MNSRTPVLSLIVVAILLASGCSGSRRTAPLPEDVPTLFPNHPLDAIRQAVAASADTISSFSTRASVRLESPELSNSFGLRLQHRRADSLAATVTIGPGVRVGNALVTPDSFFVYDRVRRRLFYNSVDDALQAAPLPVSVEEVFDNLIGLVRVPPSDDWEIEADTLFYYLRDPDDRVELTVDPRIWRVTRMVVRDDDGLVLEERTFSDFDLFGEVYLPRRLIFRRPPENSVFSLYHRNLDLNPDDLSFDFKTGRISERILFPDVPR